MAGDEELVTRELARQLATLTLSVAAPAGPGYAVAAVACRNVLCRLGLDVPLCAVADLTALLSGSAVADAAPAPGGKGLKDDRRASEVLGRYSALLRTLASIPAVQNVARRPLSQELQAVLLARIFGDAARHEPSGARGRQLLRDLPLGSALYSTPPSDLAGQHDRGWAISFLSHLVQHREVLLARAEQIDLGPLRLLGLFPDGAQPDLLDLYGLINSPAAGRAVEVSLQLLPSILETKRAAAAQRLALDGYASIERRGSLDSLLPSELAHDSDVFDYKAISDELLYYGHERREELVLREHWVLIDASASMRGVREAFARGLGIALGKKLHLQGDAVSLRFFDGRLHRRVPLGAASGHELPYFYCFRSERGRNYARVFEDVLTQARRVRRRGQRSLFITFITHGECHVPLATMESLSEVARLYGLFVLPSRPPAQSYLPVLHQHQIVTAEDLAQPQAQKARGLSIVEDVAKGGRAPLPANAQPQADSESA